MAVGVSTWRETGIKWCPTCKSEKPLQEYSIVKKGKRAGHPAGSCKKCRSELHSRRVRKDPTIYERIEWPSKLKKYYGISVTDYENMLSAQGGKCAICRSSDSSSRGYKRSLNAKFAVDHCHKTKKVRGLLCTKCNRALGMLDDNVESVLRMAEYLRVNQSN
jgi:hypothetical protein